jgi:hypothetical protein
MDNKTCNINPSPTAHQRRRQRPPMLRDMIRGRSSPEPPLAPAHWTTDLQLQPRGPPRPRCHRRLLHEPWTTQRPCRTPPCPIGIRFRRRTALLQAVRSLIRLLAPHLCPRKIACRGKAALYLRSLLSPIWLLLPPRRPGPALSCARSQPPRRTRSLKLPVLRASSLLPPRHLTLQALQHRPMIKQARPGPARKTFQMLPLRSPRPS